MPQAPNPVQAECEQFVRLEIERVGIAALDRRAIVARYLAAGASRARIYAWIKEAVDDSLIPPPTAEEAEAATIAAAVEAAAKLEAGRAAKAAAEVAAAAALLEAAANEVATNAAAADAAAAAAVLASLPKPAVLDAMATAALASPPSSTAPTATGGIAIMPDSARGVLEHLQSIIEACGRVLTYSHTADGRVRNPKMMLMAAENLRKCLETALKLYESINNVQQVERFMTEMIAEVRLTSPDVARGVVERMKAVTGRWSH